MPRFKSLIFYQNTVALKLSYFCKKMQNFRAALPPDPSLQRQRLGDSPPDPQNSPPLRISGYAPVLHYVHKKVR